MIVRDQACIRDLLWRIEVGDRDQTAQLSQRLTTLGWANASAFAQLLDLESPDGHRLIIVPRTGRVQLRVSYLVPRDERKQAALRIYDELMAIAAQSRSRL